MKTAVEWLVDEIKKLKISVNGEEQELAFKLFEQAVDLEKEQIINSWNDGFDNGNYYGKYNENCEINSGEQYHNLTFKDNYSKKI